jgi:YebC/PmpR family DNA-binding regulatory protein
MSGHSKWSTIKHKKALTDAKKANVFTKLAKDISIAAREGGDPEMNFKLRMAIDKARGSNMPKDNIDRAIKRGTGELKDGAQIEEIIYEAYGPGQIAMLIKVTTDNRNRTLGEIHNILNKNGGKMVEGGSVSWQFEHLGILEAQDRKNNDEEFEMLVIESGAKDYKKEGSNYAVFTQPQDLQRIRLALEEGGAKISDASLSFVAKETVNLDESSSEAYEGLCELLEEHDDVAEIFDNMA